MGIAVALLAPDTPDGKPTAPGRRPVPGAARHVGGLQVRRPATNGTLCDGTGSVTHGHYAENGNHAAPSGKLERASPGRRPARSRSPTSSTSRATCRRSVDRRAAGEARHEPASSSTPRARGIYHTITTCAYPVPGPDRRVVPGRRTGRPTRAARSTSTRRSSASARRRSARPVRSSTGRCPLIRRTDSSPARS